VVFSQPFFWKRPQKINSIPRGDVKIDFTLPGSPYSEDVASSAGPFSSTEIERTPSSRAISEASSDFEYSMSVCNGISESTNGNVVDGEVSLPYYDISLSSNIDLSSICVTDSMMEDRDTSLCHIMQGVQNHIKQGKSDWEEDYYYS